MRTSYAYHSIQAHAESVATPKKDHHAEGKYRQRQFDIATKYGEDLEAGVKDEICRANCTMTELYVNYVPLAKDPTHADVPNVIRDLEAEHHGYDCHS